MRYRQDANKTKTRYKIEKRNYTWKVHGRVLSMYKALKLVCRFDLADWGKFVVVFN